MEGTLRRILVIALVLAVAGTIAAPVAAHDHPDALPCECPLYPVDPPLDDLRPDWGGGATQAETVAAPDRWMVWCDSRALLLVRLTAWLAIG